MLDLRLSTLLGKEIQDFLEVLRLRGSLILEYYVTNNVSLEWGCWEIFLIPVAKKVKKRRELPMVLLVLKFRNSKSERKHIQWVSNKC
jgi:hypothetical protein